MYQKAKRLFLGIASSLLLATGFVQAAEHLDPLTSELQQNKNSAAAEIGAPDCVSICNFVE